MAIEQGSEGWRDIRAGKLTASEFKTICDGSEAAKESLMLVLAFERLSQKPRHEVNARSLTWGKSQEPVARMEYEMQSGNIAFPCEFIAHPDYNFIGASPDFKVMPDGGGEIKCPIDEAVHLKTWLNGIPPDHMWQVQGGIMCCRAKWWDFCSWHPNAPDNLKLYRQRIHRDDKFISDMLDSLLLFEAKLRQMVKKISAAGDRAAEFRA